LKPDNSSRTIPPPGASKPEDGGSNNRRSEQETNNNSTPLEQQLNKKPRRSNSPKPVAAQSHGVAQQPPPIPNVASVSNLSVQHQVTNLHFQYEARRIVTSSSLVGGDRLSDRATGKWYCQAKTVLYVITEQPPILLSPAAANSNTQNPQQHQQQQQMALHLRGSCVVSDVKVEAMTTVVAATAANNNKQGGPSKVLRLLPVRSSFYHVDPLQHVLIKPASTYRADTKTTTSNTNTAYTFDADSQSSRGATGMTTSLRAASIASTMGELRLAVTSPVRDDCFRISFDP
jgi:hypothetical protein